MIKRLLLICLTSMLLVGCADKQPTPVVTQCPTFPQPDPRAVDKIQSLKDPAVDAWMVQLFKLKQQLKASKEKVE